MNQRRKEMSRKRLLERDQVRQSYKLEIDKKLEGESSRVKRVKSCKRFIKEWKNWFVWQHSKNQLRKNLSQDVCGGTRNTCGGE